MTTTRLFACLLSLATSLQAQTITVTGGANEGPPVVPVWNIPAGFTLGTSSGNASIIILGGAKLFSDGALVATGQGFTTAATISGAGSQWISSQFITLGVLGYGTMLVSDGGYVASATNFSLGSISTSSGMLTVTGAGSLVESGNFQFGGGGASTVRVEAGAHLRASGASYLGLYGSDSLVTITGAGSVFDAGTLWVGTNRAVVPASGNASLTVSSGAKVTAGTTYIGTDVASSTTSTVTVSGVGTRMENSGALMVGHGGNGTLLIASGAVVTSDAGFIGNNGLIGNSVAGAGVVTVTGAASVWNNTNALYVAETGSGSLTIADGGQVTADYSYIGTRLDTVGTATVSGTSSLWQSTHSLAVGYGGSGTLTLQSGARVEANGSYLGYERTGSGIATVSGAGTLWTSAEPFRVGDAGTGTLTVAAGGRVRVAEGSGVLTLARESGSGGTLNIGSADPLTPSTAGVLEVSAINFGAGTGRLNFYQTDEFTLPAPISGPGRLVQYGTGTTILTGNNTLTESAPLVGLTTVKQGTLAVKGATARLEQTGGSIFVGDSSGDNGAFRLSGGAQVVSAGMYLGYQPGSAGAVTITGAGSKWVNSERTSVGNGGHGSLTIEAGGVVTSTGTGFVARQANTTGTMLVTGAGSAWLGEVNIQVGSYGVGTLVIANGGFVSNLTGFLGAWSSGNGAATVNGAGSLWANASEL